MKMVSIYTLADPRTPDNIRYVGKTCKSIKDRWGGHVEEARSGKKTYRHNWIRELLTQGLKPVANLLESVPASDWQEAERFWIEYLRFLGFRLTNLTRGGEGTNGYRASKETREKYRLSALRRYQDPEQHVKRQLSALRQFQDPRQRVKLSLAMQRRLQEHPEFRVTLSIAGQRGGRAHLGIRHTQEAKEKMSLSQQRRFRDPAQYTALLMRRPSAETREKQSLAARRRFQDPKQLALLCEAGSRGRLSQKQKRTIDG